MHSVLVYNVTHSDLILGVAIGKSKKEKGGGDDGKDGTASSADPLSSVVFARPKFSFVEAIARNVLKNFMRLRSNPPTSLAPSSTASSSSSSPIGLEAEYLIFTDVAEFTPSTSIFDDEKEIRRRKSMDASGRASSDLSTRLCVGFSFADNPLTVPWNSLHLRGSADPPDGERDGQARIVSAFLPLAAQVIPEWSKRSGFERCSKYVLLVCGTGRPQDKSTSLWGNSTMATAELIRQFLTTLIFEGEVNTSVEVVDSSAFDVFDYDQNVSFIRTQLMPRIESIRRLAALNSKEWRTQIEVTVSLTEGSPARLGALSAALRTYRPWYAHLCQLKTFWHEKRIFASDLRFYSFERVETTPPLVVDHLANEAFRAAVAELCKYRDEFQRTMMESHELQSFWLRKSNRPVLSVLVVAATPGTNSSYASPLRRELGESSRFLFYRGINLEVSQPTGSLCSERNAIGSALAANPGLNRRDVKMVAVLALPQLTAIAAAKPTSSASASGTPNVKRMRSESIQNGFQLGEGADVNPLGPCGACTEWLKKIAEVNPDFKVMTFRDISCRECFLKEVE